MVAENGWLVTNALRKNSDRQSTMEYKELLIQHGITNPGEVLYNLSVEDLIQAALANGEGELTNTEALVCKTGEYTGRSPQDKFIVEDATTAKTVDWGKTNKPISPEHFAAIRKDQLAYLQGKRLYVREAAGGADPHYRLPIRVINENAWTNLFARQLFLRPTEQELQNPQPRFTIIHTPKFFADPKKHGTRTGTFVVVNFTEGLILIGGTEYAGEIKKSIFTVLNFMYPTLHVFPMHCSANISNADDPNPALFFGLSGTGKTTLSADPQRLLIGDDEHGWSDSGVFNFEGGCYAKCINLSREKEPQIWDAIRRGTILENVVIDPQTKVPNFNDTSLTENTRAAYPLDHIEGAVPSGATTHPRNVLFLTCDAFGVLPPISKLTPEQAMYHFLSGYTAKVAGTEKGMGNTPQLTFSTCFGAPFLPLPATRYAELLGHRLSTLKSDCWLVNTGWVGGAYGTGERIKLSYTRAMVNAAVGGQLKDAEFVTEPVFGLSIPKHVPGVPDEVLNPRNLWTDGAQYDTQAKDLARQFVENFQKFAAARPDLVSHGPKA